MTNDEKLIQIRNLISPWSHYKGEVTKIHKKILECNSKINHLTLNNE